MEKITELKDACKSAIDYLNKSCNPYKTIIINKDRVVLLTEEISASLSESND